MAYIVNTCPYCDNGKKIVANRTLWLIHLASHREEIIKHITNVSDSCEFCSYSELFTSKKHASSHYRWTHKKSELLDWVLSRLQQQIMVPATS